MISRNSLEATCVGWVSVLEFNSGWRPNIWKPCLLVGSLISSGALAEPTTRKRVGDSTPTKHRPGGIWTWIALEPPGLNVLEYHMCDAELILKKASILLAEQKTHAESPFNDVAV